VVAIGATAMIGTIKTMIEEADNTETPLQQQLDVFGKYLSITTIILAIISFVIAFWDPRRPNPGQAVSLSESFAIAVGIAVAIIPEGLPSVVTITLALGVRKMAGEWGCRLRACVDVDSTGWRIASAAHIRMSACLRRAQRHHPPAARRGDAGVSGACVRSPLPHRTHLPPTQLSMQVGVRHLLRQDGHPDLQ